MSNSAAPSEALPVSDVNALRAVVDEHAHFDEPQGWVCPTDGTWSPDRFPCPTLENLAKALGVSIRDLLLLVADSPDNVPADVVSGAVVETPRPLTS